MVDTQEITVTETENATTETETELPKPIALKVKAEGIPDELKTIPQWVGWRLEPRTDPKKKPTKVPYSLNGKRASIKDSSTWSDFDSVWTAYQVGIFDGIGIVLTEDFPVVGVDIDNAVSESGEVSPVAQSEIAAFNSYSELSPSGRGIHIYSYGTLSPTVKARKTGDYEIYNRFRFLTVTGHHIESSPTELKESPEAILNYVQTRILGPRETNKANLLQAAPTLQRTKQKFTDLEIFSRLSSAGNKAKFNRLWLGDNGEDDDKRSENDLALCSLIAFYSQDRNQVDSLFRCSPRMRPKWDEGRGDTTYGFMTIDKAIANLTAVYGDDSPSAPMDTVKSEMLASGEVETTTEDTNTPQNSKWPPTSLRELRNRTLPTYIIEDVLIEGTAAVLSGDSQSFKTFCALDMALSVFTGRDWLGKRVMKGNVGYVAGEGGWTLRNRLRASEIHYKEEISDEFYLLEKPITMLDLKVVEDFARSVQDRGLKLMVIDTLSTCFEGGKENATEDMATFARHMKVIAKITGATVLVIHHNNKSGDMRGGIALKNDVDTHITVKRDGTTKELRTEISCSKQREKRFDDIVVQGKEIKLGENDQFGKPVTSLVMQLCENPPSKHPSSKKFDKRQTQLLQLFTRIELEFEGKEHGVSWTTWHNRAIAEGICAKATFNRLLEAVAPKDGSGVIVNKDGFYVRADSVVIPASMHKISDESEEMDSED